MLVKRRLKHFTRRGFRLYHK